MILRHLRSFLPDILVAVNGAIACLVMVDNWTRVAKLVRECSGRIVQFFPEDLRELWNKGSDVFAGRVCLLALQVGILVIAS